MKETIYTIPINEVFSDPCGCPICLLARRTEEKTLEYIMGAAMMEPDVRQELNETGLCASHYADCLSMNNRLSLALTEESRLDALAEKIAAFAKSPDSKKAAKLAETGKSCFVCRKVESELERYYANLLDMWHTEEAFRALYASQKQFCIPHFMALLEHGFKALPRKIAPEFARVTCEIEKKHLAIVRGEVGGFTKSFDYRYAGQPFEKVAQDTERDNYMTALEAKEYGLIDEVIASH